jgi:hypothetical protein
MKRARALPPRKPVERRAMGGGDAPRPSREACQSNCPRLVSFWDPGLDPGRRSNPVIVGQRRRPLDRWSSPRVAMTKLLGLIEKPLDASQAPSAGSGPANCGREIEARVPYQFLGNQRRRVAARPSDSICSKVCRALEAPDFSQFGRRINFPVPSAT